MRLRFTKMHGLGNDFVVIDAVTQRIKLNSERVRKLADRRFGVGCDQVLIVEAPTNPDMDFRYRIFNADGSEVEQCGNGARCFAKFVRDQKLTGKDSISVETTGGNIVLNIQKDGQVTVDMGAPRFEPSALPFNAEARQTLYPIEVNGETVQASAISMGNPHCVLQIDSIENDERVATLGAALESHPRFPQRVNVGFMEILDRSHIKLRVYERGAGETLACGTGACAAMVAARQQDLVDSTVTMHLRGGDLSITWNGDDSNNAQPVMMTGPASTIFHGQIKL
ncbi:MAG: diaminopimelate epimerase [Cellvibrionaceae bacterium]